MSSTGEAGQPRWWRRTRDLAVHAAREACAVAAETMYELDMVYKDLPDALKVHHQSLAARTRGGSSAASDHATREWDALSAEVDAAMSLFLEMDSTFNRNTDYEQPEAERFVSQFESATQVMRTLTPKVEAFRDRHSDLLASSRNLALGAPRAIELAETAHKGAQSAQTRSREAGFIDPQADQNLSTGAGLLDESRARLRDKDFATAQSKAKAAEVSFKDALGRYGELAEQAAKVRTALSSVQTRIDGLRTQHDRLPPLMSDLRRRYTMNSWKHVEDAPARVDAALGGVEKGIVDLQQAVRANPFDVPAAAGMLRLIRDNAAEVDAILRTVTETRNMLDAVAADPTSLLTAIRSKTVHTRRFLDQLPAERAARFKSTFESLATRTENLRKQAEAVAKDAKTRHPDYGAVIAEATSIEQGLDAMVRTARSG